MNTNLLINGYDPVGDPRPDAPAPRLRYWVRTAFVLAVNAVAVALLVGAGRAGYVLAERLLTQ